MKKKRKGSFFSVLLSMLLMCGGCSSGEAPKKPEDEYQVLEDWHNAQWIWGDTNTSNGLDVDAPDTWMNFVKILTFDVVPESVTTKISIDGKYWLYVNGQNVVFEGGLKRGPSEKDTYYDELDLAPYLVEGDNKIAILARYYGKNSYSHLDSGKAGLIFCAEVAEDEYVVSDSSWRVSYNYAYQEDTGDDQPNERITESNVYYNFNTGNDDWYKAEDTKHLYWGYATTRGEAGESPWNNLIKRPIPFMKDYGLKDYLNSSLYTNNGAGYVVEEDTAITVDVPYNAQLTPYIDVKAPKNAVISIKGDNYEDPAGHGKSVMNSMVSNGKRVQWEGLNWFNAQYVTYNIPAGSIVYSLQYRETGYDAEFSGSFTCNDEYFNTLYTQCVRTLYINMRDTFMDCPDRERAQWWGDVNSDMTMISYALSPSAFDLYKKGVYEEINWAKTKGYMPTVCPSGNSAYELPLQNLAGIWGMMQYYYDTGDTQLIIDAYPMVKSYLQKWTFDKNTGLVVHRGGSWDWGDWGANIDMAPQENAWYFLALKSAMSMSEIAGYDSSENDLWMDRYQSILENYDREFWDEEKKAYYDNTTNGKPDDRANAMAVFSGLASQDKYDEIIEVLKYTKNASPYLENYVGQAMCKMGYIKEAQTRIKERYAEMVNCGYSTLWEFWDRSEGTSNHAWTGGPLIAMARWFAGISPTDAGYTTYVVNPELGYLTNLSLNMEIKQGKISLSVQQEDAYRITLTNPNGCQANVYVKKTSANAQVSISQTNGVVLQSENENYWIYSVTLSGEISFIVE